MKRHELTILDALDLPVATTDDGHKLQHVNPAFTEWAGRPPSELLGTHCWEVAACPNPRPETCTVDVPTNGRHGMFAGCDRLPDGTPGFVCTGTQARRRRRRSRDGTGLGHYLDLMRQAIESVDRLDGLHATPLDNVNLQPCFEVRNCDNTDCPSRAHAGIRCWHIPNTKCVDLAVTNAHDRLAVCHACEVYERATADDWSAAKELVNDLVHLLRESRSQLARSERLLVMGELSARLAHELRSPLNSVSIAGQRLGRRLRGGDCPQIDELRRFQESLAADVQRIDEVIDRFVSFARRPMRSGALVPLADGIRHACHQVASYAEQRGVRMEQRCDVNDMPLPAELAEHLSIIVLNLALNALEATQEGDSIHIACEGDDNELVFAVSDTGRGIEPSVKERIFDPFFTTKTHGTGLGLSIITQLVREHRGSLDLETTPGVGTTFTIRFPIPRGGWPRLQLADPTPGCGAPEPRGDEDEART